MKVFLRILEDSTFLIIIEGIREVLETDIPIKEEDFEYISTKDFIKYYRLKDIPTGAELFDYIEEYTPETINTPTQEERLKALELAMLEVL